jgi:hypothetical protein
MTLQSVLPLLVLVWLAYKAARALMRYKTPKARPRVYKWTGLER